jgi:hypothetical protein
MTNLDRRTFLARGSAAFFAVLLGPTGCGRPRPLGELPARDVSRVIPHALGTLEVLPLRDRVELLGPGGEPLWHHEFPRPALACVGTDALAWVASDQEQSIVALDSGGALVDTIPYLAAGAPGPRAVLAAVHADRDRVAWCDRARRTVTSFDRRGRTRSQPPPPPGLESRYEPVDVFLDAGTLRVLDAGNRVILSHPPGDGIARAESLDWPEDGEPGFLACAGPDEYWLADRLQPRVARWRRGDLEVHEAPGRVIQLARSPAGETVALLAPWLSEAMTLAD